MKRSHHGIWTHRPWLGPLCSLCRLLPARGRRFGISLVVVFLLRPRRQLDLLAGFPGWPEENPVFGQLAFKEHVLGHLLGDVRRNREAVVLEVGALLAAAVRELA